MIKYNEGQEGRKDADSWFKGTGISPIQPPKDTIMCKWEENAIDEEKI